MIPEVFSSARFLILFLSYLYVVGYMVFFTVYSQIKPIFCIFYVTPATAVQSAAMGPTMGSTPGQT